MIPVYKPKSKSITRDSFRLALFERNPEHIIDIIPQLYTSLGGIKMVGTLIDTYALHFIGNETALDILPKVYALAKQMDACQYKRLGREERAPFISLFESTCLELIHHQPRTSLIPCMENCPPISRGSLHFDADVRKGLRADTIAFIRKYVHRDDREMLYMCLNRHFPLQLGVLTRFICDNSQLKEPLELQGVAGDIPPIVLCIWVSMIMQEVDPRLNNLLRTLYGLFVWNADSTRWEHRAPLLYYALQWYHNPYTAPEIASDTDDDSSCDTESEEEASYQHPSIPNKKPASRSLAIDSEVDCSYLFTLIHKGDTQPPPKKPPNAAEVKKVRLRTQKADALSSKKSQWLDGC